MDTNISSSSTSEWSTITSAAGYRTDAAVRHSSIERNLDDSIGSDFLKNPPLSLALGHSGSSKRSLSTACTISSAKERDGEGSMDLGLNFQLSLGNKFAHGSKMPVFRVPKALEKEPKFDLQLSLSVGPFGSVVMNAVSASTHHQDILESLKVISVPTVDEGSTSRWKCGSNLLPYLHINGESTVFPPKHVIPASSSQSLIRDHTLQRVQTTKVLAASISQDACAQKRKCSTKTCQYPCCEKGARGASRLCIGHGGGRRCQKPGCNRGAEGRTIFCKTHGGGRRCNHLGCTKSAEGRTDYCITHGGGRRCSHEGCVRAARGKSGCCIKHGGGNRCQRENCTKSAEGRTRLCISHGGGRRCQFPECTRGAQGSTMFCKSHGGGKRCTYPDCSKGAEGSTPFCKGHGGGKRCSFTGGCPKSVHGGTKFCVAHGGGKRCAMPECPKSARGRTAFCVGHGGGKRCKYDGCGKSAQGRTNFCKKHGGGKRCSWGRAGSSDGIGDPPCDRSARGASGHCAVHNPLVEDNRIHGGRTLGTAVAACRATTRSEKMKEVAREDNLISKMEIGGGNLLSFDGCDETKLMHPASTPHSMLVSGPEGRVHGAILMAFFASSSSSGSHCRIQGEGDTSKEGIPNALPHKWL
uniref:WRKY19-like zinc finger domain-containing protein n=1 Tax=Ananas comosus var. bracteatus TaxID=296719 RepID=A0A6V7QUS6_ANACO